MSSVIHNFNNDSKSWKIHAYNLQSISGDNLNLSASNNKNIYLNVSGGLVNTSYLDVSNNLRVYGNSVFASDLHTDNSSVKIPNTYNNYAFANHNNLLTNLTSQGNTWIDLSGSGYKVDYSPLSNNSKVFLHGKINYIASAESEQFISFQLLRISNNTETILFSDMSFGSVFGVIQNGIYSFDYVDSPSSSDNITYYLKYKISDDGNNLDVSSGVLGYNNNNINCLMAQELYIPSMDGIIQTVNTSLGNVFQDNRDASFNNVDISGTLNSSNTNNVINYSSHLIPTSNDSFDIGSAEYKVRDLYVSDNSIFIGDKSKLGIDDAGGLVVMERNSEVIPSGIYDGEGVTNITDPNEVLIDVNSKLETNFISLGEIKLEYWQKYSNILTRNANIPKKNMNEIYKPTTNNDWKSKKKIVNLLNDYSDASFGNISITGNIIPTSDNVFSLGTSTKSFKDVFIGPGSLYVNGKKVIEDDSTSMVFKTSNDQNLTIQTTGDSGVLKLKSGNNILLDPNGDLEIISNNLKLNDGIIFNTVSNNSAININCKLNINSELYLQSNSINSYLYTGTNFIIDPYAHGDNTGKVIVKGDLEIQGTTTTINSTTLDIDDNRIKLNAALNSDAGIDISFSDGTSKSFYYNKSETQWKTDNTDLNVGNGTITANTFIGDGSQLTGISVGGDFLSTTETDKQYLSSDLQLDFGHYIYTTYVSANGVGYGHNYLYLEGGFAHLGGGHWDGAMMASSSAYARVRNSDSRRFYGSHSYQVASDDRLKHNEIDLSNCLQTIRKLKPQKYQKTSIMKEADFNGELQDDEWVEEAGLIAQDILKIPELSWCVGGGSTEAEKPNETPKPQPYSVAYHNIEMYHIQATRELDQQVQQLKAALNEFLIASGKNPI